MYCARIVHGLCKDCVLVCIDCFVNGFCRDDAWIVCGLYMDCVRSAKVENRLCVDCVDCVWIVYGLN